MISVLASQLLFQCPLVLPGLPMCSTQHSDKHSVSLREKTLREKTLTLREKNKRKKDFKRQRNATLLTWGTHFAEES